MIVCKPKIGSLFSLGLFSFGGTAIGGFSLKLLLTENNVPWYHYMASFTLLPLALVILIRMFWGYKIVTFGKERVSIRYPFRFTSHAIPLKELSSWKETKVSTKTGTYREIEIKSDVVSIKINYQEHSSYNEALKYLEKKAKKRKQ